MARSLFITGASGVGKSTAYRRLIDHGYLPMPNHLTRARREDEVPGVDAVFVTPEAFADNMGHHLYLEQSLEQAFYAGSYYGSPRSWLEASNGERPFVAIPSNISVLAQALEALRATQVRDNMLWVHLYADREVLRQRIAPRITDPILLEERLTKGVAHGPCAVADANLDSGKLDVVDVTEIIVRLSTPI